MAKNLVSRIASEEWSDDDVEIPSNQSNLPPASGEALARAVAALPDWRLRPLRRVLGAFPVKAFFARHFEKRPLPPTGKNPADRFADLFSIDSFWEFVRTNRVPVPKVHATARPGAAAPAIAYSEDPWSFVDFNAVRAGFHRANSSGVVLDALEVFHPPINRLTQGLSEIFHCAVGCNAYFTPRESQTFSCHWDTHDVFALQLRGEKRWRIYEPHIKLPLAAHEHNLFDWKKGALVADFVMRPGDAFYMPRGYPHEATTRGTESLHLTVGLFLKTEFDLITHVVKKTLAELSRDLAFRRVTPALFSPGKAASAVSGHAAQVLALLSRNFRQNISASYFEQMLTTRPAISLPRAGEYASPWPRLGLASRLYRLPRIFCLRKEGRSALLFFDNKLLRLPRELLASLRFMTNNPSFAPRDLPGPLRAKDKVALASRLLAEGFLEAEAAER